MYEKRGTVHASKEKDDVDSEGAGDPIEHQKQVARALYEKRKQQGSYGASDNDDAAALHVVVLSSDEGVKPSHPSQDEQLAEYRRVKRAKHDTNGATDASASAADASAVHQLPDRTR